MAQYSDIHSKIWNDPKFRAYSPNAKLIFLNAWTTDSANLCCIYEYDKELVKFQTGINGESFEKAFEEIIKSGTIKYDSEKHLIWIVNRFKYRPKSPAVIASVITELNFIYNHPFIQEFTEKYAHFLRPCIDRLHTVYTRGLNKQTKKERKNQTIFPLSEEELKNLKILFYSPKDKPRLRLHLKAQGLKQEQIEEVIRTLFKKDENE